MGSGALSNEEIFVMVANIEDILELHAQLLAVRDVFTQLPLLAEPI